VSRTAGVHIVYVTDADFAKAEGLEQTIPYSYYFCWTDGRKVHYFDSPTHRRVVRAYEDISPYVSFV